MGRDDLISSAVKQISLSSSFDVVDTTLAVSFIKLRRRRRSTTQLKHALCMASATGRPTDRAATGKCTGTQTDRRTNDTTTTTHDKPGAVNRFTAENTRRANADDIRVGASRHGIIIGGGGNGGGVRETWLDNSDQRRRATDIR